MVIDLTQYRDIKEEIYTIFLKCVYTFNSGQPSISIAHKESIYT